MPLKNVNDLPENLRNNLENYLLNLSDLLNRSSLKHEIIIDFFETEYFSEHSLKDLILFDRAFKEKYTFTKDEKINLLEWHNAIFKKIFEKNPEAFKLAKQQLEKELEVEEKAHTQELYESAYFIIRAALLNLNYNELKNKKNIETSKIMEDISRDRHLFLAENSYPEYRLKATEIVLKIGTKEQIGELLSIDHLKEFISFQEENTTHEKKEGYKILLQSNLPVEMKEAILPIYLAKVIKEEFDIVHHGNSELLQLKKEFIPLHRTIFLTELKSKILFDLTENPNKVWPEDACLLKSLPDIVLEKPNFFDLFSQKEIEKLMTLLKENGQKISLESWKNIYSTIMHSNKDLFKKDFFKGLLFLCENYKEFFDVKVPENLAIQHSLNTRKLFEAFFPLAEENHSLKTRIQFFLRNDRGFFSEEEQIDVLLNVIRKPENTLEKKKLIFEKIVDSGKSNIINVFFKELASISTELMFDFFNEKNILAITDENIRHFISTQSKNSIKNKKNVYLFLLKIKKVEFILEFADLYFESDFRYFLALADKMNTDLLNLHKEILYRYIKKESSDLRYQNMMLFAKEENSFNGFSKEEIHKCFSVLKNDIVFENTLDAIQIYDCILNTITLSEPDKMAIFLENRTLFYGFLEEIAHLKNDKRLGLTSEQKNIIDKLFFLREKETLLAIHQKTGEEFSTQFENFMSDESRNFSIEDAILMDYLITTCSTTDNLEKLHFVTQNLLQNKTKFVIKMLQTPVDNSKTEFLEFIFQKESLTDEWLFEKTMLCILNYGNKPKKTPQRVSDYLLKKLNLENIETFNSFFISLITTDFFSPEEKKDLIKKIKIEDLDKEQIVRLLENIRTLKVDQGKKIVNEFMNRLLNQQEKSQKEEKKRTDEENKKSLAEKEEKRKEKRTGKLGKRKWEFAALALMKNLVLPKTLIPAQNPVQQSNPSILQTLENENYSLKNKFDFLFQRIGDLKELSDDEKKILISLEFFLPNNNHSKSFLAEYLEYLKSNTSTEICFMHFQEISNLYSPTSKINWIQRHPNLLTILIESHPDIATLLSDLKRQENAALLHLLSIEHLQQLFKIASENKKIPSPMLIFYKCRLYEQIFDLRNSVPICKEFLYHPFGKKIYEELKKDPAAVSVLLKIDNFFKENPFGSAIASIYSTTSIQHTITSTTTTYYLDPFNYSRSPTMSMFSLPRKGPDTTSHVIDLTGEDGKLEINNNTNDTSLKQ